MEEIKVSLFNMQSLLSAILTDEQLRDVFLTNPERVFDRYELSSREMESLRKLDAERMVFYASALKLRRTDIAFKAFPMTKFLVSDEIGQFTAAYCQEFPPAIDSANPVLREYIEFYEYLARLAADGKLRSKYVSDILEYEKTIFLLGNRVEASRSASEFAQANGLLPDDFTMDLIWNLKPTTGVHVEAAVFTYDVIELASHLGNLEEPDMAPKMTYLLFSKTPDELGVKKSRVNKATLDLVSLCDGTLTTRAILAKLADVDDLEIERDGAKLAATCLPIFKQLCSLAVISFKQ